METTNAACPITSWENPPSTSAEECQRFKDEIAKIQQMLVANGKVAAVDRAVHYKQLWGGKGRLEFAGELQADLRGGVLEGVAGQSYVAAVRFSNGLGYAERDAAPDVRGLAVKTSIGGRELDLLLVNGINFSRDAAQFMRFVHIFGLKQAEGDLKAVGELVKKIAGGEYDAREAARITARLGAAARLVSNLASETFWSQPMQAGKLAGRFVVTRATSATRTGLVQELTDRDYLRHTLEADLEAGDVRLHLGFEAFTEDAPLWDASVHGAHVLFPVADLVLPRRSKDAPERAEEERVVGMMAFNPANGLRMLGTMDESNRAEVYRESAKNRGAWGWDHPEVQRFFAPA
ncbi:MAG: catalase family protein [Candidatus Xenobia bacterium]